MQPSPEPHSHHEPGGGLRLYHHLDTAAGAGGTEATTTAPGNQTELLSLPSGRILQGPGFSVSPGACDQPS